MTTAPPRVGATLARIRLNPHSRAVQRDLYDADQMHKTLMRLVPDHLGDAPRRGAGLLYRLEEDEHASTLLIQATAPLDPARLPADYGHTEVKDLAPMFAALRPGLRLRYRIAANPTKQERLPLERKNQRGKVLPLTGPEADQWWTRRAADVGLAVHTLLPTPLRPARTSPRGKAGPRHSLTRFDGTATVTDPHALTAAVLEGIGRGKSHGAGLLSLAPAGPA